MSLLDGIKNKKIEVAPCHSDDNENELRREIPLLARLAIKVVYSKKYSAKDSLTPTEFITLYSETNEVLRKMVFRLFPNKAQKDSFDDQIDLAQLEFISELSEPESDTALIRAIKTNIVKYQPFNSEDPSECYFKVFGYIQKRLLSLLKKHASANDRDYLSLNDSVKDYLKILSEKGVIEKYNKGYRITGNTIEKAFNPKNPGKDLLSEITFRREQCKTKAYNHQLPQNIDKIISKLQNTYFETRDITELLYSFTTPTTVIQDTQSTEDDESISILENTSNNSKTPEELAIEKIANEEMPSVSEIISEIEYELDSECKQVNQQQKNRNKYRMIQLGYLASQIKYFENKDINTMHKEHLELLTPNHPDYAKRILNFLDKFTPADSNKIKAGLSTIKANVASFNTAFEVATSSLTLVNQLRVKQEYASKLVKHYFELLGEAQ